MALIATTANVACLKDFLRGGDQSQEANPAPKVEQAPGRDAYSFQITSVEQAAVGGGLGVTLIGWLVTFIRAWRAGKDRDTLIRAIEHTERFPSAKPTKAYIRDAVRNQRINERVKKLTKYNPPFNRSIGHNGPEPKDRRPEPT